MMITIFSNFALLNIKRSMKRLFEVYIFVSLQRESTICETLTYNKIVKLTILQNQSEIREKFTNNAFGFVNIIPADY